MCGRARCALEPQDVWEYGTRVLGAFEWTDRDKYTPTYNASPGFWLPVVTSGSRALPPNADLNAETAAAPLPPSSGSAEDEPSASGRGAAPRRIHTMRWGLVPAFTKPTEKPNFWNAFNARSESLGEKPTFSRLLASRRCVAPLEGFYEWQAQGPGGKEKQPYYLSKAGGPLPMAGLWDTWVSSEGGPPLHTFTVLTTDSSRWLGWLHNRMPVVLRRPDHLEFWLSDKKITTELLRDISTPPGDEWTLTWHPVTRSMSKVGFDGPECSRPLPKNDIGAFFKRPGAAAPAAPAAQAAAAAGGPAVVANTDAKPEPVAVGVAGEEGEEEEEEEKPGKAAAPEPAPPPGPQGPESDSEEVVVVSEEGSQGASGGGGATPAEPAAAAGGARGKAAGRSGKRPAASGPASPPSNKKKKGTGTGKAAETPGKGQKNLLSFFGQPKKGKP